jgi:hypothetical protein
MPPLKSLLYGTLGDTAAEISPINQINWQEQKVTMVVGHSQAEKRSYNIQTIP